jgi:hypothetical protein
MGNLVQKPRRIGEEMLAPSRLDIATPLFLALIALAFMAGLAIGLLY